MLAAQDRQAMIAGGWRPDARASVLIACGASAVVVLAFLALLHRPAAGTSPTLLSLSVVHPPAARAPVPHMRRSAAPGVAAPPPLTPLPAIPGFILSQQQVDEVVRDTVLSTQSGALFLTPPAQKYDELDRALQAPEKPGTLRDGESYRSIYGDTVLKSGGGCASLQEVDIGPVAKAGVGFIVPCPGEQRATMTDGLAQWAEKRARAIPPP